MLQTTSFPSPPTKILWRQVWGLAALLAAITFSWITYGFYQPKILVRLGFANLAIWLGIWQGLLGAIVEPVLGWYSDRFFGKFGSRLPQIVVGVVLAGLIFTIASWLVETELSEEIRWIVPLLMTVWTISMIIFRGPAIALLMGFAPTDRLPQASSILALVFSAIGAISPIFSLVLKQIGASRSFILGAIALLIGAILLWSSVPRHIATVTRADVAPPKFTLKSLGFYALPFLVGFGSNLEISLLLNVLPHSLFKAINYISIDYFQSGMLLIASITTLTLQAWFKRLKAPFGMGIGLAVIAGCLTLALLSPNGIYLLLISILSSIALGLVFTNTIPIALSMVNRSQAGFGTGLFFGGSGLASAIFAALVITQGEITPIDGALLSLLALAIASICLRKFLVHQQINQINQ